MTTAHPFEGTSTAQEYVAQLKQDVAASRRRYERLDREMQGERPLWKVLLLPQPLMTASSSLWVRIDLNFREATSSLPKTPSVTLDVVNEHYGWVRARETQVDPAARSILTMTLYSPLYAEAVRHINWPGNQQAHHIIYHLARQPEAKNTPLPAILTGLALTDSWDEFQTVLGLPESLLQTLLQEHLSQVREQQLQS